MLSLVAFAAQDGEAKAASHTPPAKLLKILSASSQIRKASRTSRASPRERERERFDLSRLVDSGAAQGLHLPALGYGGLV